MLPFKNDLRLVYKFRDGAIDLKSNAPSTFLIGLSTYHVSLGLEHQSLVNGLHGVFATCRVPSRLVYTSKVALAEESPDLVLSLEVHVHNIRFELIEPL